MTIYCTRVLGLPASRMGRAGCAVLFFAGILSGCDVQWGGASFHLEDPSPPAPAPEAAASEAEVRTAPLPEGPLLWVVTLDSPEGARATPVALLPAGTPAPLEFPSPLPADFRARFDSAFAAPGTELALLAGGTRLGSLVLSGASRVVDAGCPSVVTAQVLLPPGAPVPSVAFAVDARQAPGAVRLRETPEVDNRIRTFGPILAEQLLRAGGEDRPFLAQRAELAAVPWPGDERPAMAATYFINDSFETDPPQGEAVSLFFLARFDPASGYVVDWSEMRSYSGGSREAYTWLSAMPGLDGRIDFAVLRDGQTRRLAASVDRPGEERGLDWTEGARCPALDLTGAQ